MRGKKVDTNFLSQFLSDCLSRNITEQENIVERAKSKIAEIDEQIKEAEKLKVIRSKLLDVVSTFEKTTPSRKEEIRILSFFKIQKPEVCKFICHQLKDENIEINSLYGQFYPVADVIFCVKQLQEHRIVSRMGDVLVQGEMYNDYVKFVFREV